MHDIAFHRLIRAEEREVTILFADLRGFTELASSLETNPLFCELLAHVMDCLTEAVLDHQGFIIDYYGDGLVAMWNAPVDQSEHAELACRAGLQMLETLPEVAAEWNRAIHAELKVGIGVHSGAVQVGNAGSSRQFKYGARGPNMHLASRVEAATKELRMPLVATRATVVRLRDSLIAHRLCRAALPGLPEPVDLFAVGRPTDDASRSAAWRNYGEALWHFEHGCFQQAADALANIDATVNTVPRQFLSDRVQQELGTRLRRRSTDKPAATEGLIALTEK